MLETIDAERILSELIGLKEVFLTCGDTDPEFSWKCVRKHCKRLLALMPSDPELTLDDYPCLSNLADTLRYWWKAFNLNSKSGSIPCKVPESDMTILNSFVATFLHRTFVVPLVNGDDTPDSAPAKMTIPLTPEDKTILEALADENNMTITIEGLANVTHISERTVGPRLKYLQDNKLTHRPLGIRKGSTITNLGLSLIGRS